jgi:hypothetical protein
LTPGSTTWKNEAEKQTAVFGRSLRSGSFVPAGRFGGKGDYQKAG